MSVNTEVLPDTPTTRIHLELIRRREVVAKERDSIAKAIILLNTEPAAEIIDTLVDAGLLAVVGEGAQFTPNANE